MFRTQPSTRVASLALVAVLLASSIAPVAVGAAPTRGSGDFVVVETEVSPTQPTPGDEVSITPTLKSLSDDAPSYGVNHVELREGPGDDADVIEEYDDVGRLAPNGSLSVPLSATFNESGNHTVYVEMRGSDSNGDSFEVFYPVNVTVREVTPQLDIDVREAVAGTETNLSVSVANGLEEPVRQVAVEVESDALRIRDNRQVRSRIDSGTERAFDFSPVAQRAGTQSVDVTVAYTTADGVRRTVSDSYSIGVDPLEERVSLQADAESRNGTTTVDVSVANLGNVALEDVVVSGSSDSASVSRTVLSSVDPSETGTATLSVSSMSADNATIEVTADYEVADETGSASVSTRVARNPGRITLTGVSVAPEAGHLRISGSASNLGVTEAKGIVVSVVGTDQVTPAQPNRQYFVGTVPGSEFTSFEVTASVDGNVSSIPLRVSYLVDGDRQRRTVEVPVDDVSREGPDATPRTANTGPPIVPIAAGVVVLAAVVFVWRRRRGGD